MFLFFVPLILVALLMLPFIPLIKGAATGRKVKYSFLFNLCGFLGLCALTFLLPGGFALAAEEAAEAVTVGASGMKYIGAAISVGLASLGGGIAVAGATPAAIGAVSEDPKSFGKALIFVALGEGFALYGMLISFMILNA